MKKRLISCIMLVSFSYLSFYAMEPGKQLLPLFNTKTGVAENQNEKYNLEMEDKNDSMIQGNLEAWAVYDGHSGDLVSEYAKNHLLRRILDNISKAKRFGDEFIKSVLLDSFKQIEQDIQLNKYATGSTAIIALLDKAHQKLYTANLGDSRAVLSRNGNVVALSTDHKPNNPDERKRIEEAGGKITGTMEYMRDIVLECNVKKAQDLPAQTKFKVVTYEQPTDIKQVYARFPWEESSSMRELVEDFAVTKVEMLDPETLFFLVDEQSNKDVAIELPGDTQFCGEKWPFRILNLAISRTLGDLKYKSEPEGRGIIAIPEIKIINLEDSDEFIILASDGLWDVMNSQDAVDIVKKIFAQGRNPQGAATALVRAAIAKGSKDNITAIVVQFVWKKQ